MAISNQFAGPPWGISFRYADGTFPEIAKVTGPQSAFVPNDTPQRWQDVGLNFLGGGFLNPPALVVSYSTNVNAASGAILDIDHDDVWKIEARNGQTQVVATLILTTSSPNTGNALATYWSIVRTNADIYSVLITLTSSEPTPGFAFDNFSTTNLPTPVAARLSTQVVSDQVSLQITGTRSAIYSIERSGSLVGSNWTPVATTVLSLGFVLPSSPFTFTNFESTTLTQRFYRAVGYR